MQTIVVNAKNMVILSEGHISTLANKVWKPSFPRIPGDRVGLADYLFGKRRNCIVSLLVQKTSNLLVLNIALFWGKKQQQSMFKALYVFAGAWATLACFVSRPPSYSFWPKNSG